MHCANGVVFPQTQALAVGKLPAIFLLTDLCHVSWEKQIGRENICTFCSIAFTFLAFIWRNIEMHILGSDWVKKE